MKRVTAALAALAALSMGGGAYAQANAPTAAQPTPLVTSADLKAGIAAMEAQIRGGKTFVWRPVLRAGATVAALEFWAAPGKPAVHPGLAEYVTVIEGSGTLVSGGTLVDPKPVNAGQIDGERIEGGVSRRLRPGDVFMVPPGVPHWFGVDGGRLVLLGVKIPDAAKP